MSDPVFDPAWTQPRQGSFQVAAVDDTIADESEIGADRRRARTTRVRLQFTFVQVCNTAAARAAVQAFIITTVKGPLIPFLFTDPVTGTVHRVRFVSYPTLTHGTCEFSSFDFSMVEV